jgi:hypothetical protein
LANAWVSVSNKLMLYWISTLIIASIIGGTMNGRLKWSGFACVLYLLLLISKQIGSWRKGTRMTGCKLRKRRLRLCLG